MGRAELRTPGVFALIDRDKAAAAMNLQWLCPWHRF
ncbi:MAG: hypothetical protein JWM91_310 [Rhodospirillales bacterium]|nr:hypothetical protein [Rhodospirillales bacterium]